MKGVVPRLGLILATLGSITGAAAGAFDVLQNQHFDHGMFRIAALTLKQHWNDWASWTIGFLAVVVLASLAAQPLRDRLAGRGRTALTQEWLAAIVVSCVLFVVAGYVANVRWLPSWYSTISLTTDLAILAGSLVFAALLHSGLAILQAPRRQGTVLCALLVLILAHVSLNVALAIDRRESDRPKWNLVWIVIDALRADHLGCYGYPRNTSPNLDTFAGTHVLFRSASTQESYTQASVPSYFTSTYPFVHKVLYDNPKVDTLHPRFLTIAEILGNDGYATAAFVFNPHLEARYGFDQGFELYDDNRQGFDFSKSYHETFETARKIHEKTARLLATRDSRPVFLYLHYRDVHDPYAPPPPYDRLFLSHDAYPRLDSLMRQQQFSREDKQHVIDLYDGEIRYTDSHFPKLLWLLEANGIRSDNTIIVVTADHGEEFYDPHPGDAGGTSHGRTLYREQVHVPLILAAPGLSPATVTEPVGLIDLVPTLLDLLGIDPGQFDQFAGRSLAPFLRGTASMAARSVIAGGNRDRIALLSGDWKYYAFRNSCKESRLQCFVQPEPGFDEEPVGEELYNVRLDPGETVNRISEQPDLVAAMRAQARQVAGAGAGMKAQTVPLDPEIRERLRALGYVHE